MPPKFVPRRVRGPNDAPPPMAHPGPYDAAAAAPPPPAMGPQAQKSLVQITAERRMAAAGDAWGGASRAGGGGGGGGGSAFAGGGGGVGGGGGGGGGGGAYGRHWRESPRCAALAPKVVAFLQQMDDVGVDASPAAPPPLLGVDDLQLPPSIAEQAADWGTRRERGLVGAGPAAVAAKLTDDDDDTGYGGDGIECPLTVSDVTALVDAHGLRGIPALAAHALPAILAGRNVACVSQIRSGSSMLVAIAAIAAVIEFKAQRAARHRDERRPGGPGPAAVVLVATPEAQKQRSKLLTRFLQNEPDIVVSDEGSFAENANTDILVTTVFGAVPEGAPPGDALPFLPPDVIVFDRLDRAVPFVGKAVGGLVSSRGPPPQLVAIAGTRGDTRRLWEAAKIGRAPSATFAYPASLLRSDNAEAWVGLQHQVRYCTEATQFFLCLELIAQTPPPVVIVVPKKADVDACINVLRAVDVPCGSRLPSAYHVSGPAKNKRPRWMSGGDGESDGPRPDGAVTVTTDANLHGLRLGEVRHVIGCGIPRSFAGGPTVAELINPRACVIPHDTRKTGVGLVTTLVSRATTGEGQAYELRELLEETRQPVPAFLRGVRAPQPQRRF